MEKKFDAVAFDIDGTLYPNRRFYFRLAPFVIRNIRLFAAFVKARKLLHGQTDEVTSFYDRQARIMAGILKTGQTQTREKVETHIYRGWEKVFKNVKCYEGVTETLETLKNAGHKLAVLSDFPIGEKLRYLKVSGFWDVELCSEASGSLKPSSRPFLELARRLEVPPERILFVGNSVKYDITGAKNAGMKAALIRPRFSLRSAPKVDFVFSRYADLTRFITGVS
jgi:putative hydrolase of the HAD superfamily